MNKENLKEVPLKEGAKQDGPAKVLEKKDDYNVEIIRDFYGKIDPFYLSNKNPQYAYRFLRDDPKNISIKTANLLFQKGGWQLCPKKHLLELGIKEREFSSDGLLRRGDTVLAYMPIKLFKEKEKYKIAKAREPLDAVKRLVKEGDSKAGAGIHETMKGIQTKEKLGM